MGEVVNLRRARKARDRAADAAHAAVRRAAHGRSAEQKQQDAAELGRRDALLDGAKRED